MMVFERAVPHFPSDLGRLFRLLLSESGPFFLGTCPRPKLFKVCEPVVLVVRRRRASETLVSLLLFGVINALPHHLFSISLVFQCVD
jgi:hypothetical protein